MTRLFKNLPWSKRFTNSSDVEVTYHNGNDYDECVKALEKH